MHATPLFLLSSPPSSSLCVCSSSSSLWLLAGWLQCRRGSCPSAVFVAVGAGCLFVSLGPVLCSARLGRSLTPPSAPPHPPTTRRPHRVYVHTRVTGGHRTAAACPISATDELISGHRPSHSAAHSAGCSGPWLRPLALRQSESAASRRPSAAPSTAHSDTASSTHLTGTRGPCAV